MGADLERACKRAATKLFGGWLILAALVGVRLVTSDPSGIESEVAELDAVREGLEAETRASEPAPVDADEEGDASLVARVGERVRGVLPGDHGDPDAADRERLVSCRVGGGVQFMRAADCATRGGRARDLAPEPERDR